MCVSVRVMRPNLCLCLYLHACAPSHSNIQTTAGYMQSLNLYFTSVANARPVAHHVSHSLTLWLDLRAPSTAVFLIKLPPLQFSVTNCHPEPIIPLKSPVSNHQSQQAIFGTLLLLASSVGGMGFL